jgi:chemotaxis protein MotA
MISLPIGFLVTLGVIFLSIKSGNIGLFMNMHSILIVGGGTLGIMLFSSPLSTLKNLFHEVGSLFKPEYTLSNVQDLINQLAQNKNQSRDTEDELIKYAQELWQQGTSPDLFVVLLSQKRKEVEQRSADSIQALKNLAKYPPALGMAGTVMGIVELFQGLNENKSQIGPAFAMALTATFFGLIISNVMIMPLADRMHVRHMRYQTYLSHLYSLLLLINQEEAPQIVEDEVKARAS